ncbi:hypothetical protein ACVCIH_17795 [Burkholderia glumae]|uniref:hypothetical protein n=1 Tax=Burkholderia glumae TaxID=337 RepID=UPI002036A327|nr:hypothetical protein [Burkholderia glumae]MCM2493284.1 hypothetical protein [Burkholderia glumae]
MKARDLTAHKNAHKVLTESPAFFPMKRGKLPKPFAKMGGGRLFCTKLVTVSSDHQVLFCWRTGEVLTDTAFYGYLICPLANGALSILLEFHWHPSHKGIHCKVPCGTDLDYTSRLLVQAPELRLKGDASLDPREEADRSKLIALFCSACGISLGPADHTSRQMDLWNT